jgi:hypothetical protein
VPPASFTGSLPNYRLHKGTRLGSHPSVILDRERKPIGNEGQNGAIARACARVESRAAGVTVRGSRVRRRHLQMKNP